jgi:exopolyphosphatase/guanosine-5'-triphosphate,3'-diphosphate pyrophosphatase
MRAGIIEIGTNSIKFCIAEKRMDKIKILVDKDIITRLGEEGDEGEIAEMPMQRTIAAIKNCLNLADKYNVEHIIGVGTMVLRVATNTQKFLQKVYSECGFPIEILSDKKEAELTYKAAISSLQIKDINYMVVDIGGGSTELIVGTANKIESIVSIDMGALHITEKFLTSNPVTNYELRNAMKKINNMLVKHKRVSTKPNQLIGVGGTVTTMIAIKYGMSQYIPEKVNGAKLDLRDVKAQIGLFMSKTVEERKNMVGLQPERADVILAGALIVYAILQKFHCDSIIVSDRGLRHTILTYTLNKNFSKKINRGREL